MSRFCQSHQNRTHGQTFSQNFGHIQRNVSRIHVRHQQQVVIYAGPVLLIYDPDKEHKKLEVMPRLLQTLLILAVGVVDVATDIRTFTNDASADPVFFSIRRRRCINDQPE